MSANAVNVFGVVFACRFFSRHRAFVAGCLDVFVRFTLVDFMDGNIAALHGPSNAFRQMIDGLVDSLTFLLFIALMFGKHRSGNPMFGASVELFLV